jgi:hypothetical protein
MYYGMIKCLPFMLGKLPIRQDERGNIPSTKVGKWAAVSLLYDVNIFGK